MRAYGLRASEIAQSPGADPKLKEDGPFQDYVGVDGTTIWAATTSSLTAIACKMVDLEIAIAEV
jgi:hypothetical protein